MRNIIRYENIELLYNILAYALIIVGVLISCSSMWYEYFTVEKNIDLKKNITKKWAIINTLILLIVILAVFFQSFYNITNDVFDEDYLYAGNVVKGKADGYGKKYYNDGCIIYNGKFKANMYKGIGKYYNTIDIKTGECCKGDEEHTHDLGNEENEVVHILRYEGEFKNNLYNGKGKKYLPRPDYSEKGVILEYDGDFVDNHYCGKGKQYDSFDKATGLIYSYGSFGSKDESKEIITYLRYNGEFDNDEYNGSGELYYTGLDYSPDNPILEYKGEFRNNMKNGQGIEYDIEGNVVYEGLFVDDQRVE